MFFNNLLRSFKRIDKLITRNVSNKNTIFGLSSGFGKCGVSIIRVSGDNSLEALRLLLKKPNFQPKPRYATLTSFFHPKNGELIDKGLLLWFPGPNSFTGEDSCEFQVHGSLAVISAMTDALLQIPGVRMAEKGEFTKRSFFSGKLDLTEVEGLADLIHAETEAQRKQALLQSTGALSKLYNNWRKRIIQLIAHLEAYIDFAEDDNIEDDILQKLSLDLKKLIIEIKLHLNDNRKGEILREGVRTVIIGQPNVGKSSFLNIICQKPISIVTPIAGTTTDIIETQFNIGDYPVIFADTAGLRKETHDIIESEGMSRALNYMKNADMIILMIDALEFIQSGLDFREYKEKYLEKLGIKQEFITEKKLLIICNKMDLLNEIDIIRITTENVLFISCKENMNIDKILNEMKNIYKELCGQPSPENPRLTQARYRGSLIECCRHLEDFEYNYCSNLDVNQDLGIAAQKLRLTVRCIEKITGHVSTDEILDVIFRDFCIGK